MDSLRTAFFEDPFYVYLVLILVEIGLFAAWYGRRRKVWLWRMLLPIALGGGLWLLERAVVTDRERILAALDDIARAVERGDIDAAGVHLDENYSGWGIGKLRAGKQEVLALAKGFLALYPIREVRYVGRPQVRIIGKARAEAHVQATVRYAGKAGIRPQGGAWKLEWIKQPEGWRIRRAESADFHLP